jgi:YgiT-type zinc finger domain-containing protein
MRCHVCGAKMEAGVTTLPFKVRDQTMVIIKRVPVQQCASCSEYVLEDVVMAQIDKMLTQANAAAELEVIEFAA